MTMSKEMIKIVSWLSFKFLEVRNYQTRNNIFDLPFFAYDVFIFASTK